VDDVEIRFLDPVERGAIVTLGGAYHVFAPRYPKLEAVPDTWSELLGVYDVVPRSTSFYHDGGTLWTTRIALEEGILRMPDEDKLLLPVDERTIHIVGGIFDGETMVRDPETGVIEWGSFRYVPVAFRSARD
jgi:hypothetical protein